MSAIFILLFFAAIIGVFKPYIGSMTRKHFGLAALIFFIGVGVTAPEVKEDAKKGAEKVAGTTTATKVRPADKPVDHAPTVNAFQKDVMAAMKSCDESSKTLADVATKISNGRNSIYDGYAAASAAETSCQESWSEVSKLEAPDALPDAAQKQADETLEVCENAVIAKQMGAEKLAEIFDGNMRPSTVQEAKELGERAQAGILACAAGFFLVADKANVDIKKLKFGE